MQLDIRIEIDGFKELAESITALASAISTMKPAEVIDITPPRKRASRKSERVSETEANTARKEKQDEPPITEIDGDKYAVTQAAKLFVAGVAGATVQIDGDTYPLTESGAFINTTAPKTAVPDDRAYSLAADSGAAPAEEVTAVDDLFGLSEPDPVKPAPTFDDLMARCKTLMTSDAGRKAVLAVIQSFVPGGLLKDITQEKYGDFVAALEAIEK